MKFFHMWYTRQNPKMQQDAKMLIKQGRLEIAMGGWVAPDETCTNYEDVINNFIVGHHWLKKEFGYIPRIAW
jgi:alpha-mannosidase